MGRLLLLVVAAVLVVPAALGLLIASTVGGTDAAVSVGLVWVVVAVVVALAGGVLWRTWAPVRGLIAAAGRLADGAYDTRVATDGPMITRPVIASFNRMAARLEADDAQRRRLLADVGHELRTPLTVLRGDLEAMVDGVRPVDADHLRSLLDDVAVVERLLDDLRTLSLAESGALVLHREPADIAQIADEVAERLAGLAAAADVALVTLPPPRPLPVVEVDPTRVHQVVANLVGNAIGATPAGGSVTVATDVRDGAVVLEVRDTGRGIPTDEVDAVFERFHSGAGSSGSGLGLTISRDLVEAHGGTLTIADTSSRGTTMRVRFPVPAEPRAV